MKFHVLLVIALVGMLVLDLAAAEKPRKHKKTGRRHRTSTTTSTTEVPVAPGEDVMSMLAEDEKLEDEEAAKKLQEAEQVAEAKEAQELEEQNPQVNEVEPVHADACHDTFCGAGKVCQVNDAGQPECVCIPNCPEEVDPRRKVCSNHNETWGSDCEVYRQRCMCDVGSELCKGEQYKHVHIEYYGVCREMRECSAEEMMDFPRRMRDWLFNVMRDLADREELSPYFLKMEREAETNLTRRWTNAAVWKWCDLDGHPHDRSVSRHELFPIRAPLMALEHCIAPFLNKCDADNDHLISLKEWGKCLELDEEDLEDKCDEVRGE